MIALSKRLSSFSVNNGLPRRSKSRVFKNFLDCGVPSEDAAQTILSQGDHPELDGFLLQGNGWRAFVNQFADRVSNLQKLINPLSAFVAGIVTRVTSFTVIKLLFAYIATGSIQFCKQCLIWLISRAAFWANAAQ